MIVSMHYMKLWVSLNLTLQAYVSVTNMLSREHSIIA